MDTVPFDTRMDSDIFSVNLAHAERCRFTEEMSDESIDDAVKAELDSSVYVQKYTDEVFKSLHQAMIEYNATAKDEAPIIDEMFDPDRTKLSLPFVKKQATKASDKNKRRKTSERKQANMSKNLGNI